MQRGFAPAFACRLNMNTKPPSTARTMTPRTYVPQPCLPSRWSLNVACCLVAVGAAACIGTICCLSICMFIRRSAEACGDWGAAVARILSSLISRCAACAIGMAVVLTSLLAAALDAAGALVAGMCTNVSPVTGLSRDTFCVLTFAMTPWVATTASRHEPCSSVSLSAKQGRMPRSNPSHHLSMAVWQRKGTDLPTRARHLSLMFCEC
mmetsp:Transcript_96464/g.191083  ORF Transcript_96464/g.191083 Transcript_96464/m.191083 type:complete len:208 (-) Transcript_96464:652-1275(-)